MSSLADEDLPRVMAPSRSRSVWTFSFMTAMISGSVLTVCHPSASLRRGSDELPLALHAVDIGTRGASVPGVIRLCGR